MSLLVKVSLRPLTWREPVCGGYEGQEANRQRSLCQARLHGSLSGSEVCAR